MCIYYLHSTLVILQLDIIVKISDFIVIYIPLWLYYNPLLASLCKHRRKIYIPLWLYYNGIMTSPTVFGMKSTFHSGYITMSKIGTAAIERVTSTFHSGYITMRFLRVQLTRIGIYIPLWLYYNRTVRHAIITGE